MRDSGFSLVELLCVVAIISVLAAIAIPQFNHYRTRAYDAAAVTDLRTAATAQESHFIENSTYVTCGNFAACLAALDGMVQVSPTVEFEMTGTTTSFTGSAYSINGSRTFNWDSANGGLQ